MGWGGVGWVGEADYLHREDRVDGHDEHEDGERVAHSRDGRLDRHDHLVERGEPLEQPEHAERAHQAEGGDAG